MTTNTKVTVSATITAPVQKVWDAWNNPEDIKRWNTAHPEWHCPSSENDLREGGSFKHRMEARDGSFGFDFGGIYDKVVLHKEIVYTMSDGRTVTTLFEENADTVTITSTFDAESENPVEFQQQGWQAILNNFVQYVTNK
jgi:uncharacterized protein YndB with AHSA1/START domain